MNTVISIIIIIIITVSLQLQGWEPLLIKLFKFLLNFL